jgi:hypothetical protein
MTAASVWLRSPPFAFPKGAAENCSYIGVFRKFQEIRQRTELSISQTTSSLSTTL